MHELAPRTTNVHDTFKRSRHVVKQLLHNNDEPEKLIPKQRGIRLPISHYPCSGANGKLREIKSTVFKVRRKKPHKRLEAKCIHNFRMSHLLSYLQSLAASLQCNLTRCLRNLVIAAWSPNRLERTMLHRLAQAIACHQQRLLYAPQAL